MDDPNRPSEHRTPEIQAVARRLNVSVASIRR